MENFESIFPEENVKVFDNDTFNIEIIAEYTNNERIRIKIRLLFKYLILFIELQIKIQHL